MNVNEIQPGMKGFGLSVFKGTKIDTFDVEIIDIMKNYFPKCDLFLAKISGPAVDKIGIAQGMSGSPIYISDKNNNPKLIGALAYDFTMFPKDSGYYVGITPISSMIEPPNSSGSASVKKSSGGFTPIRLPITLPSNCDEIIQDLNAKFPFLNVLKIDALSGEKPDSIIPVPGLTLGIPLVEGDVTYAAIGTCTYVEGDKIWAFGHSFNELGETELPMTSGYIYSTIPSNYISYKLGISTKIIGSITKDNVTGVSGIIGKMPKMIETNLNVNSNKFHYRIANEKRMLPFLFALVASNSIYTGFKFTGDVTASSEIKITSNEEKFEYKNIYVGGVNSIVKELADIFNIVQGNPFKKININEVSVNLSLSDTVKFAKINGLWTDKSTVKTKDTINIVVLLSTYQEGVIKKSISLELPRYVEKGDLWLSVESGRTVSSKVIPRITTLNGLKKWLAESPLNNELVIKLSQKGKKSQLLGDEFQSLPPSVESLFEESPEGRTEILEKRIPTEWVLAGENIVKLEVK